MKEPERQIQTMKLRKARIIVEPLDETNERWMKALQGKVKGKRDEEVISVGSWKSSRRFFLRRACKSSRRFLG